MNPSFINHDVISNIEDVFAAIEREREYQDDKWGIVFNNPHEVAGWLLIMQSELNEAKESWVHSSGNEEALKEILQVISVGVACLQQHGVFERAKETGDSTQ